MKKNLPSRTIYFLLFLLLIIIEVLIACFINDSFIRPYLGDVIVVWAVYSFVQIFLANHCSPYIVCIGVFLFAILVEIMQGIHIVELLGLENNPFFRTLIGTQFDRNDIVCYTVGSLLLVGFIFIRKKKEHSAQTENNS